MTENSTSRRRERGGAGDGNGEELQELVRRTAGRQPWRRVFHAASGLSLAGALVAFEPARSLAAGVLAGLAAGLLLFDVVRLHTPWVNRLFFRLFQALASPREAHGIASSTWFVLGCFAAVAAYPGSVAVAAVLVLALADPAASYVGRRWGRRRLGAGTVTGSAVFIAVSCLVLVPFAGWGAALAVALATAALESIPWVLDDNLVIPVGCGAFLWLALAAVA